VFRKTGIAFCCFAFFFLAGGHWAVLQSVAWATMIIDYAKAEPLAEALSMTFDGAHPCGMCKEISKSKKTEREPIKVKSDKKVESLASTTQALLIDTDPVHNWLRSEAPLVPGWMDSPPVPPPKTPCIT
jgi:hypothetical protein